MDNNNTNNQHKNEPRFTFDEVMGMIDQLLAKQNRSGASATASLKRVNFEDITVEGHSVESCKELIEVLIQNTRRVRTLKEVLTDIKDNLKKSRYTEIIAKASIEGDLPKRPPSAYLLYHADRYNDLKEDVNQAVEISKIVAEEWKNLSDKKRRHYQRRHDEMMTHFENKMHDLGLVDEAAPKRPKSAKTLYIDHYMSMLDLTYWTRDDVSSKREKLGITFDNLPIDEKQKWFALHKEGQEKYQSEREKFIASHPHLSHQANQKKPRLADKEKAPEPPKTAVKFYIARKLSESLEGQEREQAIKVLKDKFHNLREKKQLKYIKKAVQDKERYDREFEEYRQKNPDRPVTKAKTNLTKEQQKLYTRVVENRPELPAPTAYLFYCGKILSDMITNEEDYAPTKRMKLASERWRKASAKERKTAVRLHIEDMDRYVAEMERWLATQPEDRRMQLFSEEPKANPEYWRKKLNRIKKKAIKDSKVRNER